MWIFITGLFKAYRSQILIVGIGLLALRWYGNHQYDQGIITGINQEVENRAELIEQARQEEREALELEKQSLAIERADVDSDRQQLNQDRQSLSTVISARLNDLQSTLQQNTREAVSIPDSDVNAAFRAQLNRLAAIGQQPTETGGSETGIAVPN